MSIEYVDLADYIGIASEVTGLDESMVVKIANLDLGDSALCSCEPPHPGCSSQRLIPPVAREIRDGLAG